jgi:hypothetical protein
MARCRGGHLRCSPMAEGQSTVEEYSPPDCRRVCRALSSSSIRNRSRAAILRRLARETRDQAARERLLLLAARFERLADQVEKWQKNRRYRPAD